jgi:hypothetical protein
VHVIIGMGMLAGPDLDTPVVKRCAFRQRPQLDVHTLVHQPWPAPDAVAFALQVARDRPVVAENHQHGAAITQPEAPALLAGRAALTDLPSRQQMHDALVISNAAVHEEARGEVGCDGCSIHGSTRMRLVGD